MQQVKTTAIPAVTATSISEAICDMIVQLTPVKRSEVKPAALLRDDLALDSVASMELLSMLDDAFELELEMEDVIGIETVGEVIALAQARLGVAGHV